MRIWPAALVFWNLAGCWMTLQTGKIKDVEQSIVSVQVCHDDKRECSAALHIACDATCWCCDVCLDLSREFRKWLGFIREIRKGLGSVREIRSGMLSESGKRSLQSSSGRPPKEWFGFENSTSHTLWCKRLSQIIFASNLAKYPPTLNYDSTVRVVMRDTSCCAGPVEVR